MFVTEEELRSVAYSYQLEQIVENDVTILHMAINAAVESMHQLNLHGQALMLTSDKVLDGGGIKTLTDNVAYILDKMMPEDEKQRAELMEVFDKLLDDFAKATAAAGGEVADRIGNEIMIDAKDLM